MTNIFGLRHRRPNVFVCALLVTILLMIVSIISNLSHATSHKDYTNCETMGEVFYQLAVFRLQGYPRHLAEETVKQWNVPKSWQEKHVYMVKWVYVQGAAPPFAKAEAIAYCKTGVRPEITRPTKPPQPPPKAAETT